ncbi:MAG TPA: hypothetical protein VEH07_00225 [Alphaproteobacteria bacterium]|nr:hypothetical protein [Alphaproteobacteria bacterium]
MYKHSPLPLIFVVPHIPVAAADEQLIKKPLHQAGPGTERLELVTWDCDWHGGVTVSVIGQVKNISAVTPKQCRTYVQVRNATGHVIGVSNRKTFDIPKSRRAR